MARCGAMVIRVQTRLDLPPEAAWELIAKPSTFLAICRPLLGVTDPSALPDRWQAGDTYDLRLSVLGIPANRHTIHLIKIDEANGEALTNERGGPLRRWNHRLYGKPDGDGATLYTDEIDIGRGLLVPLIWLGGSLFFRYRQRNLRRLAREGS
jgi:ligand-binding SRPBCC domain-containing protein